MGVQPASKKRGVLGVSADGHDDALAAARGDLLLVRV